MTNMKLIWKANRRRYLIDIGRNDVCPCGSHMKLKYCCLDKLDAPYLKGQGKNELNKFKSIKRQKRQIKNRLFRKVARNAKRFSAKITRRNYNG
jgi:hypothetical protein